LKHQLRSFPLPARLAVGVSLAIGVAACGGSTDASPTDGGPSDATRVDALDAQPPNPDATTDGGAVDSSLPVDSPQVIDAPPPPIDAMPPMGAFCSFPGSVLWAGPGPTAYVMPGAPAGSPDLTWLKLPAGFCAHYFGNVTNARQLRFAPGGELFVASPTTPTTGGTGGAAAIFVLPDDNQDGIADQNITFLNNLPSTQGLLFANGAFYYQDDATIRSITYNTGDRMPSAQPQAVTTITAPQDGLHWPKVMDIAMDGTIYITNGGSQGDVCLPGDPVRGGIFKLNSDGSTTLVSKGFRNPIAMRCETNHDVCVAAELAWDYSWDKGGREKLVPIRAGDDWGFPCCATKDLPYLGMTYLEGGTPDCSGTAAETDSFVVKYTPFGVDFETGKWPAPWTGRAFVTLHGQAGDWTGIGLVSVGVDPSTGALLPGTDLAVDAGANTLLTFASGWESHDHGRPAPITFAADGRMFLGNDNGGTIVWIAPIDLMPH
jgi:glucose/arabinose dehydrogenase